MPLSSNPEARGNQLANLRRGGQPGGRTYVRHGAYAAISRERITAKVREVLDAISVDAPLREADGSLPAADGVTVHLLAECLVRANDVSSWLGAHGWLDENDEPRTAVLELERRLRAEAANHADAMGMNPRSRARLGLDTMRAQSIDLAKYWADQADDTIEGTADAV